jgi:hypothetical protein
MNARRREAGTIDPLGADESEVQPDQVTRELIKQRISLAKEQLLGDSAQPPKQTDTGWLVTILFAPGYTR